MAWLRLIRWQNLLIIVLTQLVVWWCVIAPEQAEVLGFYNCMLLILSTVLIAAAGYIINDYFDVQIDQINHPDKVVLGKTIPRKSAIIAHTLLNIAAIWLAGMIAFSAGHMEWLAVQIGCTALLWMYSTRFKRAYISGNIAISFLTGLTVVVLFVYEPVMHQAAMQTMHSHNIPGVLSSLPVWILAGYAFFAFIFTWIREIVKDMEDLKGDEADGCVTMPVVKGLAYSARFASVLAVIAAIPLIAAVVALYYFGYLLLSAYVLLLLVLPTFLWIGYLWRGKADSVHYHMASRWLKVIMVLGVCTLLLYKFR